MRKSVLLSIAVVMVLTQVVCAQEEGGKKARKARARKHPLLTKMDGDGDGKLSQAEFRGPEALFSRLDEDADGSLNAEEVKLYGRAMSEMTWERVDRGNMFQTIDADGDGVVTKDEFEGADLAKIVEEATRQARMQVFGGGKRAKREKKAGVGGFLGKLDKDGDGMVSRDEFPQDKIDKFDRFDKDGDGFITKDELAKGGRRKDKKGKKAKNPEE